MTIRRKALLIRRKALLIRRKALLTLAEQWQALLIRRKALLIGFDASRAFVENRTVTENYSFELLKALAKNDTENDYLIYIKSGEEERAKSEEWPDNFQFKIINYKYLWTQVGLAIRTFIDPLDVLFVPANTLPLIKKPGLKTVITVHDLGVEYLPGFHQVKQILYLKLMTYYQLKSATIIIAVSEATKKDLVKKAGIKSEKIKVVYEGVGEEFKVQSSKFKVDVQRDILKQYGLEKKKYFLFVGTIQPRKNLERIIRAFAALAPGPARKLQLILVGSKGWLSEEIYDLPKKLGIEGKVKFLGHVADEDLGALYSGAIALVFPSLFEGFGLPILEAFACKCPVITSNISSMPEIAGDAGLLVNPEKVDEISEAMLKIVSNDKLRNSMIQKGLERLKRFSWEKSALKTVEILMEAGKQ
ncbi:glycosyltransferase family 4 protein [Candidatus Daviesbacteria bacterium]|nr:glycosyltransferase family 4 protein [Candidatus Daviesbacteria bacterium]